MGADARAHPAHTFEILHAVPVFRDFAYDAAAITSGSTAAATRTRSVATAMSPTARVLAVADITDALLADRPYRAGLAPPEVVRILETECADGALCSTTVRAAVARFPEIE